MLFKPEEMKIPGTSPQKFLFYEAFEPSRSAGRGGIPWLGVKERNWIYPVWDLPSCRKSGKKKGQREIKKAG